MSVQDENHTPQSPRRLPWPAVALGVSAFLLVVLAVALWSDRTLRPRVGPEPTSAPTPVPPTEAPVAVAPTPIPAATSQPVAAPTPVAWWNWRSEVPPDLRDEIWSAYLNYWQVVADAHKSLDTSQFDDVMTGPQLGRAEKAVQELSASRTAQDISIQHHAQVVFGATDIAVVKDEYTSLSQLIDLTTGLDIPDSSPPFVQQISFLLNKIGGKWKVTDAVRYN